MLMWLCFKYLKIQYVSQMNAITDEIDCSERRMYTNLRTLYSTYHQKEIYTRCS